jgi:hypothetical protein
VSKIPFNNLLQTQQQQQHLQQQQQMLSPACSHSTASIHQTTSHSQSLTRLGNHTPGRFKSLTTQLSDDYTYLHHSQQQTKSAITAKKNSLIPADLTSSFSSKLLSPNDILSKSNSSLYTQHQLLEITQKTAASSQLTNNQHQAPKQMQKKHSKSVDASFKKGTVSASSSPRLTPKLDINKPHQQTNFSSASINHSPLIPRRTDYEPVHRVTIQRQQRVQSPCQPQTTIYKQQQVLPLIISNNQNASDSGLSGIDDSENGELKNGKKSAQMVLLNRPATLDLKPSFINTSKQSEGGLTREIQILLSLF